jgi:hypothetical protein
MANRINRRNTSPNVISDNHPKDPKRTGRKLVFSTNPPVFVDVLSDEAPPSNEDEVVIQVEETGVTSV